MNKDRSVDGLRGIAAVAVFLAHFFLAFYPAGFSGYYPWVSQADTHGGLVEAILSLPVVSALWNGRLAVCIFFVLSGYVLTRSYQIDHQAARLRNQAYRRYFRLGIPVLGSMVFAFALITSGAYHIVEAAQITHSKWLVSQNPFHVDMWDLLREGTYGAMLRDDHSINPVTWSMRVEFMGSMLIFAYALLARRRPIAMAVAYMAVAIALSPNSWPYYSAFLLGFHIAPLTPPGNKLRLYAAAVMGVILASINHASPLWALTAWLPNDDVRLSLYNVLGGGLIVYAVRLGVLRALLCSWPVQFLGSISFPVYLVHLPIILSAGCALFVWMMAHGCSKLASTGGAFALCMSVTMVVAWAFERIVDQPAIRFAKWMFPPRKSQPAYASEMPSA